MCGGSAAVSSQFHIVALKSNCHVKSQSCSSLVSWYHLNFSFGFKKCHFRLRIRKRYLKTLGTRVINTAGKASFLKMSGISESSEELESIRVEDSNSGHVDTIQAIENNKKHPGYT